MPIGPYNLTELDSGAHTRIWEHFNALRAEISPPLERPGIDYVPASASLTVGNGTLAGRWRKLGTTLTHARIRFTFGSTTAITGNLVFYLPTPTAGQASNNNDWKTLTGPARIVKGANEYSCRCRGVGYDALGIVFPGGGAAADVRLTNTTLTGWAAGDSIYCEVLYERAASA